MKLSIDQFTGMITRLGAIGAFAGLANRASHESDIDQVTMFLGVRMIGFEKLTYTILTLLLVLLGFFQCLAIGAAIGDWFGGINRVGTGWMIRIGAFVLVFGFLLIVGFAASNLLFLPLR